MLDSMEMTEDELSLYPNPWCPLLLGLKGSMESFIEAFRGSTVP